MTTTHLAMNHSPGGAHGRRTPLTGSHGHRAGITERLAIWSASRPGRTLGIWVLAVLVSLALATTIHGLTSDGHVVTSTESSRAEALYAQLSSVSGGQRPTDVIVVSSDRSTVADPSFSTAVRRLENRIRSLPGIADVRIDLSRGSPLVSSTGGATIIQLRADSDSAIVPVEHVVGAANNADGLSVTITGQHTVNSDVSTLASSDLRTGEIDFGLPIALIVLVLVFGAVVAGLLPLLMAILSIAVGLGVASLISQEFHLSTFIVNMMTAMGLALGIDYSLFIVSRFREERGRGFDKEDAIRRTAATAGRAVLFSGSTFAVALVAMFLVPTNVMRSLAAGAIIVGVTSVAAALTLLPAMLALLGDRVSAGRLPFVSAGQVRADGGGSSGIWRKVIDRVILRPGLSLLIAGGAMLMMAIPVLGLHIGQSGVATLPSSAASKQGYVALERAFPDQSPSPVEIVAVGPPAATGVDMARLRSVLATNPTFGLGVLRSSPSSTIQTLTVPIQGDPVSTRNVAAVRHLRGQLIPATFKGSGATVLVGGQTADVADYFHAVTTPTPFVLLFVLGVSFLLLLLAFRSVVIALVSILLNVLGVGAAYGLLTLVFIHGWGTGFFGFEQVTAIDAWVPLFLFSVLFALSMDYQVFLMSRIKERFDVTGSTREAVASGVASTARIVTGAALIIIVVFAGFARGQLAMFQQMGCGVAVALFLDATLVRMVILPAVLTLLGDRSWYLPSWLTWLPHLEIESPMDEVPSTQVATAISASAPKVPRGRRRRGLRWPVTLGGLAVAVVTTMAATTTSSGAHAPQTLTGPTPAYGADFADPSVLVAHGRYYAYATQLGGENIQMISSKDLQSWTRPKDALPELPLWAVPGFTWAPAVEPDPNGGYQMYFAARDRALGIECIGRAVARTPIGPFTDPSHRPFVCQVSLGGSIDPSVFEDGGSDNLIWKSDGANGAPQRIWSQAFDRGDNTLSGSPVPLLSATTDWEAGVVEGPAMLRLGGSLHLYFSANRWSSYWYSIGSVTCESPLGPCRSTQPRRELATTTGMIGPGGPSFFMTASGRTMMAFAAWTRDPLGPLSRRGLFITELSANGSERVLVSALRGF
jgi:RND superfamily putative drug exporter